MASDLEFIRAQRSDAVESVWDKRYGGSLPASANSALDALLSHRSVRKYLPRAVPEGTLEQLVAAAQSAASSSNLQLWSVISVEDPERRRALAEVAGNQAHIQASSLFFVWIADLNRLGVLATRQGLPHVGLSYLELFLMAAIDAALAAQNAVVAAEALGLGTVYIGALRNSPDRVAQILKLPEHTFAVFGLCVGYPDPAERTAVKPRLPQNVVLHRDEYQPVQAVIDDVAAYDATMSRFYTEQNMKTAGEWSRHSALRVSDVASLRGRDRLREHLSGLGFELK